MSGLDLRSSMARYLVTLQAPDEDAPALEAATAEGDDRVAGIVRGDVGKVPVRARVPIEIEAPTTTSADKEARRIYDERRARAGLPGAEEGLPATINPLNPLVTFNMDQARFFMQAERIYDEGHYDFTVVAAQTACELLIGGRFSSPSPDTQANRSRRSSRTCSRKSGRP